MKRSDVTRDRFGMYGNGNDGPVTPLMGAYTLLANEVFNPGGEDLGCIHELMIDLRTGSVAYAVLSFGGWMGMGNKLFAVPWGDLKLDPVHQRLTLPIPRRALQESPGFDKDRWPTMADRVWTVGVGQIRNGADLVD